MRSRGPGGSDLAADPDPPARDAGRPPPSRRIPHPGRPVTVLVALVAAIQLVLVPAPLPAGSAGVVRAAASDTVKILGARAESLDPAGQGDSDSAAVTSQLFESLTAIDADAPDATGARRVVGVPRRRRDRRVPPPARPDVQRRLAADRRRRRPELAPAHRPGPPVAAGQPDRRRRRAPSPTPTASRRDPASVGLSASGNDVTVHLTRPATDFPAIVASPTFGIVPPGVDDSGGLQPGPQFVGSGGYVLTVGRSDDDDADRQQPLLGRAAARSKTVQLVHDIGGRELRRRVRGRRSRPRGRRALRRRRGSPGTRRSARSSGGSDALSLSYYGFDTSRPPFDDVRVRQAFARAVDWRRLESLSATASSRPATGMVPPGIPGRSDADFLPAHDPDGARALARRGRLPRRTRLPDDGAPRRRHRGPGVRRGDPARARRHDRRRGPGRRLLRPARPGSAADLLDGLDRRLSGPERLPRDPPRHRGVEQLRPLVVERVRRGGHEGARRAGSGGRPGCLRHGGGDRPGRGAGDPALVRRSTGRWRGPGSSAPIRTGSGSSGWQGWHGPAERRPAPGFRHRSRRSRPLAALVVSMLVASPVAAADPVKFGLAECQLVVRGRRRLPPAGHAAGRRPARGDPRLEPGRDRSDRPARRGPAGRRHHPPLPPRRRRRRARPEHARSPASGGSSPPTAPRPSGPRSPTPMPTTATTGRRWKVTSSGSTGSRATRRSASAP